MTIMTRQRFTLPGGTDIAYVEDGDPAAPAVLLLHGTPNSADMFRDVIPVLARQAHVIAPDLPGFGASEPLKSVSFEGIGRALLELLAHRKVGPRYVYLHDYGAPPGLHVAMAEPDRLLGLIVQNANAHRTGFSEQWKPVEAFWSHPDAANEAASTAHLTAEGTRDQYTKGVPADIAAKMDPRLWAEDWRVMSLPGRLDSQRALVKDYGNHVARFGGIAQFLKQRQPPALMIWGRHDIYFELDEVVSWMRDLPRMECHVLDAAHLLLETHSAEAAALMSAFIARTRASQGKATGEG